MGIPKFYRWLSERYPLLNQKITLTEGPPEIDNLYLDMNGIIHNCTHANRKDIGSVKEEDMMLKVFDYLEKLIQIVRPQKLLFMAIDGVAPRAKMNQQRSRRFKSALERLKNEEDQRRKGEVVPDDAFDSNCITPGTEFMARLGKHLRFFVRRKMADDPLWQKPNVVFSGHEVPGEGEHKIMEYIRWEKRQPSYQPNQRHCMYGLDADLVMLSLVTHEPHFCLLREVVSYTGANRGQPAREVLDNPCAENFILFQIGLLREYFELEFGNVKLPFPLDLERIVDDYVLMCMLVGNDFLPALPTLDIAEGALNKLMELYKELLPSLGGYLTYAGDLDRRRLEVLLERIGQMELQTLEDRAQDAEFMESKRAKRTARMGGPPARSHVNELDAGMRSLAVSQAPAMRGDLLNQPLEPIAAAGPSQMQGPTMMSREARQMMMAGLGDEGLQLWKDRYYSEKLHADSPEDQRQVVEHYIAGLHWVLEYYYRGVASWDWYYPYHYAPMASDMINLDSIQVAFSQGTPFRPFEQLLAVLPAASCKLLPPPFRVLMTEPESPIIDFYPGSFEVDMEGKRADWEGVVLVPFVDEGRLLQAVRSVRTSLLSTEEISRNQLGQIQIFQFSRNASEPAYCSSTMPKQFGDLKVCHSRCLERPPPPPLPTGGKGFVPALVPGTRVGLSTPPGMPTLKSLQVRPSMRNVGVNVLGTPSRKDSLVLALKDLREALGGAVLSAEQVARSGLLGSRAYINWPYLQEARVVRVSDHSGQASFDSKGEVKAQRWQPQETQRWETDAAQLAATFLSRCGIDVGKVDLVVGVKVCLGYIRHSDGTIEKTYSKDEVQVPLQAVIKQKPHQVACGAALVDDMPAFPDLNEGMKVVYLGKHHFGCMGTVLPDLEKRLNKQGTPAKQGAAAANGHYRLLVQPVTEQVGVQALRAAKRVVERFAVKYYTSGEVANRAGISPRLLGRITGNMWARDGDDRYDVGLAIKTSAKDVCVPGFSQPTDDGNGWTYSAAVINILQDYRKTHPWIWTQLIKSESDGAGDLRLDQLLPGLSPAQRKDKVRGLTDWIKSTPLAKRPLVKLGVKVLSDEGVKALQTMAAPVPAWPPAAVEYENVPPMLILLPYTPGADQIKLDVQGGLFELGDRVVCVSAKGSPPYGNRGTVIGVYDEACEVVFDDVFSGGSDLNGRVDGKCGAFVPKDLLLCVNKSIELSLAKHQFPRQHAVKQSSAQAMNVAGAGGLRPLAPGPSKPTADAASRAALKAMQQQPAGGTACVPASVAVTPPASPPVPSTKLLGAAMRSIAMQGDAQRQTQPETTTGAGKALLQKLAAGASKRDHNVQPQAECRPTASTVVASAAAAAAVAAVPVPTGSLAQLQQLVPNARVGSPGPAQQQPQTLPHYQQRLPPSNQQQSQMQPQFLPPPMAQQQYQPPLMFPSGGIMQPPQMMQQAAMYQQRAPYIAGAVQPQQQFFFPPYSPMPIPGGPPMPLPGPVPVGVMGPLPPGAMGGMLSLNGGGLYPMPIVGTQPGQPPSPQQPPQGRSVQQRHPGTVDPHVRMQHNGAAGQLQTPAGQGRGKNRNGAAKQPVALEQVAARENDKPSGGLAEQSSTVAAPPRPAEGSAAAELVASADAPLPPAPKSHPIDIDALQSMDDSDEAVSSLMRRVMEGAAGKGLAADTAERPAPATPPVEFPVTAGPEDVVVTQRVAKQAGQGGANGASPAWAAGSGGEDDGRSGSAFGKSARLPDVAGRGFRGRGRHNPPPFAAPGVRGSQNGAPGSQPVIAPADPPAGRLSLDCVQAGQTLLRSLQAAATTAGPSALGRVVAPSPPNPGALLLRQLQGSGGGGIDASVKAQSLDSGTELLRALQQTQGP